MKFKIMVLISSFIFLTASDQPIYSDIDEHSDNYRYVKSKEIAENWLADNPDDVEVLWRLARAHFDIADQTENPAIHKENFYQGLVSAKKALELNPKSARANHWYAVLIGKIGILEGTKQKIINSYDVEKYAKISIELDPDYDGTYHLMGRWHYNIADLSWFERTIAGIVYATPPAGSFEEAVDFFNKALDAKDDEVRHYVWLGKSYYELSDYDNAKKACQNALKISPKNDSDKILQNQARELLAEI